MNVNFEVPATEREAAPLLARLVECWAVAATLVPALLFKFF